MEHALEILIVDDHDATREEIASLIEAQVDMCVVAQAAHGDEGVQAAKELKPDLVVMDIMMPGMNGIEATQTIRSAQSDVHILALSNHTGDNLVQAILDAGAGGYVRKDHAYEELIPAIRSVVQGETYVHRRHGP